MSDKIEQEHYQKSILHSLGLLILSQCNGQSAVLPARISLPLCPLVVYSAPLGTKMEQISFPSLPSTLLFVFLSGPFSSLFASPLYFPF